MQGLKGHARALLLPALLICQRDMLNVWRQNYEHENVQAVNYVNITIY